MKPEISIVIITYNSSGVILDCLKSVYDDAFEVIVVDNNSKDQTLETIKNFSSKVKIISLKQNKGYPIACNEGLKTAKAAYTLILNPDIITTKQDILILLEETKKHENCAISGPAVYIRHENGRDEIDYYANYSLQQPVNKVNRILGAVMLFNMKHLKQIGLFDENIFMYYEDEEISNRAIKKGYELLVFPASKFYHLAKKSSVQNTKILTFKAWHLVWSKLYYRKITQGSFSSLRLNLAFILRFFLKTLLNLAKANKTQILVNFSRLKASFAYLFGFKAFDSKANPRGM